MAVVFTGPTTVPVGSASSNFTLAPQIPTSGTYTMSDGGAGGTFTPPTITFASSVVAQTFTYTASSLGMKHIGFGLSGGAPLTSPPYSNITAVGASPPQHVYQMPQFAGIPPYQVLASNNQLPGANIPAANSYTMTGPATLAAGATGTYTLTPNGNTTAQIAISDGGAGGVITTSPVTLNNKTPVTFTYRNNTPQTVTLTSTNTVALFDPAPLSVVITPGPATAYTLTGPATLPAGTNGTYTLTGNGNTTAPITISDGGGGGVIVTSPTALNNTTGVTFTYRNPTPGTYTLTTTNAAGLTNPAPLVVTITAVAATAYTFTGPTTLLVNVNGTYTLTGNGNTAAQVTISDGGGGGTIVTSPVTLNNMNGVTFTYNNATPGTYTLTTTNAAGLTNPPPIVVTVNSIPPAGITTFGTMEAGGGTVTTLVAGASAIVAGPFLTPFRLSLREVIDVAANAAFNLDYQFTTDGGVSWYTGKQAAAIPTTADGTTYTFRARFKIEVGVYWRIRITAGAAPINATFERRLIEKGSTGN
jgi:hypothetical protein